MMFLSGWTAKVYTIRSAFRYSRPESPTGPSPAQLQGVDMFWFKGCIRCSGDRYTDHDQYGPYITCAQCGFSKDLVQNGEAQIAIAAETIPAPLVPHSTGGKRRRMSHGGRHFASTLAKVKRALTEAA